MGNIIGDLNSRRGIVNELGTRSNLHVVNASVPKPKLGDLKMGGRAASDGEHQAQSIVHAHLSWSWVTATHGSIIILIIIIIIIIIMRDTNLVSQCTTSMNLSPQIPAVILSLCGSPGSFGRDVQLHRGIEELVQGPRQLQQLGWKIMENG